MTAERDEEAYREFERPVLSMTVVTQAGGTVLTPETYDGRRAFRCVAPVTNR